jgi:hypothetical protein
MAHRWIKKVQIKKGALSQQLGIPEKENIPITLLEKIKKTEIGKIIKNPTKSGKQEIKVTKKLKKRAVLALTMKRF